MTDRAMVELSVTVSDDGHTSFETVALELRAAGLAVERELTTIGVITGRAEAARMESLRAVDGVADVELGRTIQLPPPDSPVQ